jgi:hypothetical protein
VRGSISQRVRGWSLNDQQSITPLRGDIRA